MDLQFRVFAHISKPVAEVFEAVADPDQLSHYFTTGGAKGRLETGATVTWDFDDFPGAFPVKVIEVVPNQRIVLEWKANDKSDGEYNTRVTMTFEPTEDGRTLVAIEEGGWRETEAGLKSAFGNCMGWSQMLCALKAWVERGINLREGMYR
ncbi:SRPBCC family protein [Sphingomonas tabacisoli]|uniref:SRPBCC family protein n=1 Tax=Sphingomonas tabacisoli TaxID=2249466 RepID=A0ABW4I9C9_9SPHN